METRAERNDGREGIGRSTLIGRDRIKRENRSNGGQDRMEGNIVSPIQHK